MVSFMLLAVEETRAVAYRHTGPGSSWPAEESHDICEMNGAVRFSYDRPPTPARSNAARLTSRYAWTASAPASAMERTAGPGNLTTIFLAVSISSSDSSELMEL